MGTGCHILAPPPPDAVWSQLCHPQTSLGPELLARLGAGPAEAQAGAGWMGAAVPFAGSSSPHWKGARGCPPPRSAWSWGSPGGSEAGVWSGSSVVWLPQALSFHLPLAFPCLLSPPSGPCLPRIADRPHPNSSQTLSAAQCHRRHLEPCPGGPWDGTGNSLLARASVGAGSGQTDEAANAAGRAVCGDLSPVGLPPPTPSALAPPPRTQRPSGGKGPGVDTGALCLLGWNKPPCVLFSSLSRLPRLLGPDRPRRELGKAWEGH